MDFQSTSSRLALRKSSAPSLANALLSFPSPHCSQNGVSRKPGRKVPGGRLRNCFGGGKGLVYQQKGFLSRRPPNPMIPSLSRGEKKGAESKLPLFYIPTTSFRCSKLKLKICILVSLHKGNSLFHCGPSGCPQTPFTSDASSHLIVALEGVHNSSEDHLSTI